MRVAVAVVWIVLVAGPSVALAQPLSEQDRRIAREHFDRGTAAFERGDYTEAAAEFRAAYALTRHADLLYNIYSSQERNGALAEAAEALEGYLRDGSPDATRREALELRLERLRLRIEQDRLADDTREAEARRAREAAAAELSAERAQREAAVRAAAAAEAAERARREDARATSDALWVTGIGALVAAAVALAGFGVLAGLGAAEDASLAERCGRDAGRVCRESDTATLAALNTAADASWIAGGALAVAGLALVLAAQSARPPDDGVAAYVGPLVGPTLAGIVAGGRY
ncbi:MAG: hypothetical protein KF729_02200 [Sandaracinaceae bacterium]|nr:hypothetical protein [Sandaracinaceae bacterium]